MTDRPRRVGNAVGRMPAPARWVGVSVLGVAFVLWLVLFAPRLLVPPASDSSLRDVTDAAKRHELQDSRVKLQNDVRTTLLQGLGGLAVLVGAFFTYRQVQTNRDQLEHAIQSTQEQHEFHRQGQVTERFTRAIDQLGGESPDVQLGGIYALERIANDSPQDRASIAEVLAAFVRGHAPWPPSRPGQPADDEWIEDIPPMRVWAPEAQAALTVLGRRKPPIELPQPLDLRTTDLRRADLIDAQLLGVDLEGTQLWSADLRGAQLQEANFYEADLDGADLEGADLQGASFVSAHLYGARLERAQLQDADLRSAELQDANLRGAQLQGADLNRAQLRGARYNAKTVWPDGFDWKAAGVKLQDDKSPS